LQDGAQLTIEEREIIGEFVNFLREQKTTALLMEENANDIKPANKRPRNKRKDV
jgi:hypothetical protein